jgi:rod shape determining protein RodA
VLALERAVLFDVGPWLASYPGRQLLFGALALGVLVLTLVPHWRVYERLAYPIYGVAVGMLVVTLLFGVTKNNARRWIDLGPLLFQSSEPMKAALVLALARTLRQPRDRRGTLLVVAILLTAVPVALVVRQPDLGTALLYLPILFALLYLSGYSWKLFAGLALVGAVALPVFARFGLKDYQRERVMTFLLPGKADPEGAGFHLRRSLMAIGSGRLLGTSDPEQLHATLRSVPERHTDFIFSVVGATWGLAGAGLTLLGYTLLVLLLLRIARRTRESFGRLVAGGIATMITAQAAINLAMTIGCAPITGLTLPFMSYGGSSLVTSFAALGLALNVSMRPGNALARGDFAG